MQVQLLVKNVTSNIHVRSSSSSSKLIHSCVSMGVVATARHVTACAREGEARPFLLQHEVWGRPPGGTP
jgi:hypothetical protein